MFLIDEPFVSDYLKTSFQKYQIPVIQTAYAEKTLRGYEINFIAEDDAVQAYKRGKENQFYTNSENALNWIFKKFPESELAATVAKVKDKVRFREVLAAIHPDYYFRGCEASALREIEAASLPYPVILKPSVGFFSLGVQRIDDQNQWLKTMTTLDEMTQSYVGIYPKGVLDSSIFVLEAVIPGEEFAVDCYFDGQGQVVVLNMMKHLFASGVDVNDRVYMTSSAIMEQYLTPVQDYLNKLGSLFHLKNFQAHIEIRIDCDEIAAIEINPLRFGGWCSTADLAQYAWGMNIYAALINEFKPDWIKLINRDPDKVTALIVLNNSTGVPGKEIDSFDYEALLGMFEEPLELRKTDFRQFPLFGFLMCRVPSGDMQELENLLHSDLRAFIRRDKPTV